MNKTIAALGLLGLLSACSASSAEPITSTSDPALPSDDGAEQGSFGTAKAPTCDADLRRDEKNCGACGNACGAYEACSQGVCVSSCPAGEVTSVGCEASYDVRDQHLSGAPQECGVDGHRYGCGAGPLRLEWQDHGVMKPSSVRVAFETSIFCAGGEDITEKVSLNGLDNVIGTFSGDTRQGACTCAAESTERAFELDAAALARYAPGEKNFVELSGSQECLGLKSSRYWGGAYARITVRY